MKSIWTITKRELAGYFNSPVAYVFLVIFLLMTAAFTFLIGQFMDRNQATLQPFFMWHPWIYLFLVPAVGMRLWSEERRQGTMELLLTLPISLWHCIIGKFLASWLFLTLALVMTFPIWITVSYLGDPDHYVILASYIGSFFLAGAYLSITSMTSAFTRNQVISFILSVVICLFLVLCGWPPVTDVVETLAPRSIVEFVAAFSVMPNVEQFNNGQIDSRAVIYFLSVIGFPLFATSVIIRGLRA
ncbi:MAG: ABC transporter permease subunit [Verrucomicrobia bacterium]|jgi:ABC-2 type transport system permease protein|nr:ABC transporter permease subunit [Verrucomicrobiota bacterium]MBT4902643.1 ABC transporter permease subunit [Verrucomicrobiota bacterium]MBT5619738.1 ABC transporter permease subunit [Verrucomicrobiota bacterium]MBT6659623.1 ABC transporter permease subunit [Verrucomicrobiota bacterium]MBT7026296.1 ABC transporter permease subunit [Verrucomicrobiota bacterium]